MMIGVAQVIGMKPTLSLGFSIAPAPCAKASLAAPSGKNVESAAAAVPAPTAARKRRRTLPSGIRARMTACSTSWSSLAAISCSSCDRCTPQGQRAPSCGGCFERSSSTDMGPHPSDSAPLVLHQACQQICGANPALTAGFRPFVVRASSARTRSKPAERLRLELLVDHRRDRQQLLLAEVRRGDRIAAVGLDPIEDADVVLTGIPERGLPMRRFFGAHVERHATAALGLVHEL